MAENIQSLTALRGLAALAVLAFHCAAPLYGAKHVPMPLIRGYLAVDLFFMLSGFVLMHVHERDFAGGVAWPAVKSFLRARFARTYPIHFVILLALLPLYGTRPDFSGVALIHNLLLTQTWLHTMTWNYGAWSISAEWHAYVLFPFLVMPLRRRSAKGVIVILLLCVATLSLAVIEAGDNGDITYTPAILLRCLPEFIAGMAIYRAYREGWLRQAMTGDRAVAVSAIAVLGLASFAGTDIAVVVALACLLLACAYNRGIATRLLATRLPMFLGRISYSLYMVQIVAAEVTYQTAKPWLAAHGIGAVEAAAIFILSFVIAIPLSRYVEYPMRDWLRGRAQTSRTGEPTPTLLPTKL
jgi:peptidoglycan/LPS O-acetylase OafA/YrhL